ncbi:MAG: hypothetical protein QME21_11925 [Anaerolineales bacterium]|nr:hypothetical protein [Anaerolineales bacterium]
MGAMIKAVGHYENCISTLKRAINYLKAIRSHPNMQAKELLPRKISVLHGDIEGRITKMRNAIQHLEGQVRKGNIVEGSPVFLMLEQDCIILGEYTIKYSELSGWISELHSYAKNLFRHFS